METSSDLQRNSKEASQLINEARLTDDGSDRLYLLSHVFERIFYKEKLPNLLREYFYPLLEYENDKDPSVRKFIIGALESIVRYNRQEPIQYALTALDVLLRMLNDEDESVVIRSMLCIINIYRKVLQLLAEEKVTSEAGKECWSQLNQLKEAMLKFIRISSHETILPHAYKFVEVLILSFSNPEGLRPLKSDLFNLEMIPQKHNLFNAHSLKEEGDRLLSIFQDRLATTLPSSAIIVIITALVNISRQRPGLLGKIVPILLSTAKHPPPVSHLQIPSVVHACKQALALILRIRNPVVSGLSTDIQDVLSGKYRERERESEGSSKRKRPKDEPPEETEPKPKEQAVAPKDSNIPPPLPAVIPPTVNVVELLGGLNFSLDMIVELVIENMSNFPPPGNPLNAPPTTAPPVAPARVDPRMDPRRDPRLKETAPEPTQPAPTTAPVPFPGMPGFPPGFPFLPGMMPGMTPTPGPMPTAQPTTALSQPSKPVKEDKPAPEPTRPPVKKVEDNLPPMVIPTSFPSKVPPLTPVDCKRMSDQAFRRIINSERGVLIGGQAPLRQRILSFLAVQLDFKDPLIQELKQHILDNFGLRKDLAITWLMAEFGKFQKEPNGSNKRYNDLLVSILRSLKSKLDPKDKLFISYIVELPQLPDEVFTVIQEYCQDSERTTLGLATLRDLIFRRSDYAERSLQILLSFTIHPDENVRSSAIRLVTNILYSGRDDPISLAIDKFANDMLSSLLQLGQEGNEEALDQGEMDKMDKAAAADARNEGKDDGKTRKDKDKPDRPVDQKEDKMAEDAKCRMLLYFALTTRRQDMLPGIVDIYTQASNIVRRVMHQQSISLIKTIGLESPILQSLIVNCPKKGDTLILHFLHILTEGIRPPAHLVATARNLYQKKGQDVRFLIPVIASLDKQEVLDQIPPMLNLQSNAFKAGLSRLLHSNPTPITPTELMIALHQVDSKDSNVLKKSVEATQYCFDQKEIYKENELAVVVQQLVDLAPIPTLTMRTIMQMVTRFPKLTSFTMTMLSRLTTKQVWNDKRLWEGFVKCCKLIQPQSFSILLQLPKDKLDSAVAMVPDIRKPLVDYCLSKNLPPPFTEKSERDERSERERGDRERSERDRERGERDRRSERDRSERSDRDRYSERSRRET